MTAFACRACGSQDVEPVLSLGGVPLVNALVEPGTPGPDDAFPLDVVRCTRCTLVQITETVDPSVLFRDYTYFSSYSETFVAHARAFAEAAVARLGLGAGSLVVEAASNDGYLLRWFAAAGVPVLGVEPARNVAAAARETGVPTVAEFLDQTLADELVREHGHADLVVANNVLAHVPDLNGFVAALATLAGEEGRISIEVPYLVDLVERLAYDTIYHEHLSYFTLASASAVLAAHGLRVVDVERLPVHGGSLRLHAARAGEPSAAVTSLREAERRDGFDDGRALAGFAAAVESSRSGVARFVAELRGRGASVAAYGAAAKGVVLANVCGLDDGQVAFVADLSPHKQGKLLPGVRIPVVSPEALTAERPDYCLLFAWNVAAEIVAQQGAYRAAGGRFVLPLPTPTLLAS